MMAEPCLGNDFWLATTISGGFAGSGYSVDAVGSLGTTQSLDQQGDLSGYVRSELGPRATRAVLAVSGGHAAFAAWEAADIGFALSPSPRVDFALTYRPERLDYVAATERVRPPQPRHRSALQRFRGVRHRGVRGRHHGTRSRCAHAR